MEITTLYQKTRREFGRSVDRFSSTDSYSLGEWPSDPTVWHAKIPATACNNKMNFDPSH